MKSCDVDVERHWPAETGHRGERERERDKKTVREKGMWLRVCLVTLHNQQL